MKRLINILLISALALNFLLVPKVMSISLLHDVCRQPGSNVTTSSTCTDNQTNATNNPLFGPDGILTKVVQILTIIIGIAAVITIIVAGMRLALGGSDPNTINTARNAILYAVIGLVVAFGAQALISFVLRRVGV